MHRRGLRLDRLVVPLIYKGLLTRRVAQELVLEESSHCFAYREDKIGDGALNRFRT